MRPKAGLKLRKVQYTRAQLKYPSMYDGVQMFKALKHELSNLQDAYDANEHEREIEHMRDDLLPDNCTGQDFADKVNTLIPDHNPLYLGAVHGRDRLGRLIIKLLPTALASEGRALLSELIDKKLPGIESRVIEDTMRLVKMAHRLVPVSVAHKSFDKKGKKAVAAAAATRRNDSSGGEGGGALGGRLP
eukprot:1231786-Pleurochrysis_carterae.AAC.3